jgi:hypothetical protein
MKKRLKAKKAVVIAWTDTPCEPGSHEYTEVSRYEPLTLGEVSHSRPEEPHRIYCRKCARLKRLPNE